MIIAIHIILEGDNFLLPWTKYIEHVESPGSGPGTKSNCPGYAGTIGAYDILKKLHMNGQSSCRILYKTLLFCNKFTDGIRNYPYYQGRIKRRGHATLDRQNMNVGGWAGFRTLKIARSISSNAHAL